MNDTLEFAISIIDAVQQYSDTLVIRTDAVILIKKSVEKAIDYKFLIASLISALSISFIVWDRIKKAKISGKILSLTYTQKSTLRTNDLNGNEIEINGIRYCMKISINALHKNIFYSDVEIRMKYPGDKKKYIGRQYFIARDEWGFDSGAKILKIPADKFIAFNNVLEKDKTLFFYSAFFIERDYGQFSEVEFNFKSPTGRVYKLGPLQSSDFRPELIYYEKDIWVDHE